MDAQALALRTVQQERDAWLIAAAKGEAACISLRADVARLTAQRDEARMLYEGASILDRKHLEEAAEQIRALMVESEQFTALRASIAHLHAWNSDDMQIRHRQVVLADDLAALLAAIKEPATP